MQAEMARRSCKPKLQVSFEFETSKQGFTNNLSQGLNFLKRKILKSIKKSYIIKKISPKIPEFFSSKS